MNTAGKNASTASRLEMRRAVETVGRPKTVGYACPKRLTATAMPSIVCEAQAQASASAEGVRQRSAGAAVAVPGCGHVPKVCAR